MERDPNPMPEMRIIEIPPRVKAMAQQVASFLFRDEVPLHCSDHYVREHFEPSDGEVLEPTQQRIVFPGA